MRRYGWLVVALLLTGGTGCVMWPIPDQTYGLEPVSPKLPRWLFGERTVESLTPTLKWKPSDQGPGTTYDLIVYEIIGGDIPWKEVYYREGLTMPEHQVEEPLQPGKSYYWSVRAHQDGQVSDWSRFTSGLCAAALAGAGPLIFPAVGCGLTDYPFYIFKAPK
jgi:hypothetical protein